ncbi:DUF4091 domain-containing protein [Lacrimispora sp.]|uniref:DUF4091 domain-containing protein n=1 Tax=Lacrimispora sp. TaxID=2719234 RepID=UPI002899DD2D|nr:DUF4091 domain-containing protein [Lacrimispora sp.]
MSKGTCSETLRIRILNSLAKIFSGEEPDRAYDLTRLSGLKGERVSFQIAYFWDRETRWFIKPAVISELASVITIRQVNNVPCDMPAHIDRDDDYISYTPGLYPDLLTELKPQGADLIAGQWRGLWVEIAIPSDCTAGVYAIEIEIQKDDEVLGSVKTEIEIINAVLPKLPIPHTEWLHTDCLANYYSVEVFSDEYWRITENFIRAAVKRDINMILVPVFTPPLDTAVGGERRTVQLAGVIKHGSEYSFDFTMLEKWIRLCINCGVEYFEISHLFSQWGAVAAPKIMGIADGSFTQLFGWDTKADGTEYRTFLNAFLPQLIETLSTMVDMDRVYFHISDEPELSQLSTYRAALMTVRDLLKGYKIIDALSNYAFYKEGLVEIPVCANNHIKPFLENRPEKLWTYYCTAQYRDVSNRFIAMPSYRNRVYGLQLYKYKIDGILHWGYNFYNSLNSLYPIDPYRTTGADAAFPSGDPFVVYPKADGTVEESIRFMVHYEAMTDLRALYYLETLIGREKVMENIDLEDLEFDWYPKYPEYTINIRKKVNEMIKETISCL